MTKPRPFNPQPTSNTNYDSYPWPRSKTPEKQRIYDMLFELGWRFDGQSCLWFTPEREVLEGYGRLEHAPDFSWFRIQPRSSVIDGVPHRAEPLLEISLATQGAAT